MRHVNQAGVDLIKEFEGCRSEPYQDVGGLWTIGIGHLIKPGENFYSPLTPEQCGALLQEDLELACKDVENAVTVPLSDNEFAALVSFTYNCGGGALRQSTLLKLLNQGDYRGAVAQFPRWCRAGGVKVPGLLRRRLAEAALFVKPDSSSHPR